jgi:uncharacterized protein
MKDLDRPLSDAELNELDEFLADERLEETSMDVSTLEGFLTALAIGPDTLMPSQWLPWVCDMQEGKAEPEFENLEQAQRILGLIMRHYNAVIHVFMADPASFEPVYWRGAQWGASEWCEGFLLGTRFSREAWSLLMAGQPKFFTPFFCLGTDEGIELIKTDRDAERWMNAVTPALVEIHAHWKAHRDARPAGLVGDDFRLGGQRAPVTRETPKVGRNDPCPCGSEKKFKKCCGAAGPVIH